MGWANRRASSSSSAALWAVVAILAAAAVAGCCRNGSSNRCDPPDAGDGRDGPVACGTQICDGAKVCCLTSSPPSASCVDPGQFDALGCAKMGIGCTTPRDCPDGTTCCLVADPGGTTGTISCQQLLPCLGGATSLVVCGVGTDCPTARPTCTPFTSDPRSGAPINVCE